MEAALRSLLKDTLGDYVKKGLERADTSSFPLVLRDLQLNEKKVQQEFDEDGTSAISLTSGKIGSIKVTPGWMGTVEVLATNIELSFAFSATKAMANAMKGNDDVGDYQAEEVAPQVAAAPPPPCAPRFCCNHDSSDKRVKCEPVSRACKSCGMEVVSSYKDFQLCPPCSDKEQRCLICGTHAPKSSSYIPQNHVGPQGGEMQQSERSRPGGNQASNLPPPPPPPPASSHRAGNANAASGGPSRQPHGDSFAPADTTRSMHVSRQPGNQQHQQQQHQQLAPEYSTHINEQNFSTILPQNMRVPLGGPPMGQQRGVLAKPRNGQMANKVDDESFGGFLRYVAADVWGMCNAQQNQRFDSFGGPTPSYPHGFKRGGA
mmetsp:Transcript_94508/g.148765  ORF Transcript_94508/g.148765 Transcript_94508/m.148765 type:complete len:375 (-) Transcript_94508:136-1260(-)